MNPTDSAPAGGAEIAEVVLATGGAIIATAVLLYLGWAHRTGRTDLLRRLSEFAARDTGLATWAALPLIVATGSLLVALVGMYWDISLHIDDGRDAGPLANPAHYLILFGLFGIFAAGFLAIVLPEVRPSPGAVRISKDWYAPLGGIAMMASSAFALIGFPLDDLWHRIFGQDVTLWGPTHLMLIGGAGLTLIGSCILIVEGRLARRQSAQLAHHVRPGATHVRLRRPADRALDLPGRVRLRRAAVQPRARAGDARLCRRRRPRRRPALDRPRCRDRRGAVLRRHPWRRGAARRPGARRDHPPPAAVPGRGRLRRARRARGPGSAPVCLRRPRRWADRHGRLRHRVRVVADLDAVPLAREPDRRCLVAGARHRCRRRAHRRLPGERPGLGRAR